MKRQFLGEDRKLVVKSGFEKGKKDVAKKMKQENIDLELIIKVTGLSKEQIEDL